jgi:hypothetical protein
MRKVPASFTVDPDLLKAIDQRAQRLDLTRSQYLRALARQDLTPMGRVTMKPLKRATPKIAAFAE